MVLPTEGNRKTKSKNKKRRNASAQDQNDSTTKTSEVTTTEASQTESVPTVQHQNVAPALTPPRMETLPETTQATITTTPLDPNQVKLNAIRELQRAIAQSQAALALLVAEADTPTAAAPVAEITHEQDAQDTISPVQSNDTAEMETIALDASNQQVEPPTHMTPQRRPTPSPAPDITDTREFPRLLRSGEPRSHSPKTDDSSVAPHTTVFYKLS